MLPCDCGADEPFASYSVANLHSTTPNTIHGSGKYSLTVNRPNRYIVRIGTVDTSGYLG